MTRTSTTRNRSESTWKTHTRNIRCNTWHIPSDLITETLWWLQLQCEENSESDLISAAKVSCTFCPTRFFCLTLLTKFLLSVGLQAFLNATISQTMNVPNIHITGLQYEDIRHVLNSCNSNHRETAAKSPSCISVTAIYRGLPMVVVCVAHYLVLINSEMSFLSIATVWQKFRRF